MYLFKIKKTQIHYREAQCRVQNFKPDRHRLPRPGTACLCPGDCVWPSRCAGGILPCAGHSQGAGRRTSSGPLTSAFKSSVVRWQVASSEILSKSGRKRFLLSFFSGSGIYSFVTFGFWNHVNPSLKMKYEVKKNNLGLRELSLCNTLREK